MQIPGLVEALREVAASLQGVAALLQQTLQKMPRQQLRGPDGKFMANPVTPLSLPPTPGAPSTPGGGGGGTGRGRRKRCGQCQGCRQAGEIQCNAGLPLPRMQC